MDDAQRERLTGSTPRPSPSIRAIRLREQPPASQVVQWILGPHPADGTADVPTATVFEVLDHIRAADLLQVDLLGPVEHRPDCFDLIEYAVGCGVRVRFVTSGLGLTERRARWLSAVESVSPILSVTAGADRSSDVLGMLAAAGLRGFAIQVDPAVQLSSAFFDLVEQSQAQLAIGTGRDLPTTELPLWRIDATGIVYRNEPGGAAVEVGNISEPGGFLAAWHRGSSGSVPAGASTFER